MRNVCVLGFLLMAALSGFGQTTASDAPGLQKDPRAVFAAAAPFYDFSDPSLKPCI